MFVRDRAFAKHVAIEIEGSLILSAEEMSSDNGVPRVSATRRQELMEDESGIGDVSMRRR